MSSSGTEVERDPNPPHSDGEEGPSRPRTTLHWVLLLLTIYSVFATGASWGAPEPSASPLRQWLSGASFAIPLMLILMVHEAGHYIAARIHGVPASLPFFIPFPGLSPFGTMGAIIVMKGRIRSAKALLDIGASGPLAGMLVAIPTMIVGLRLSTVSPRSPSNYFQEGESLLYAGLKWLALGPLPKDHDVFLHPMAFAAWAGFFVTFLNLLPFAQMDGGHVAFALFGRRHDKWSKRMWLLPASLFIFNCVTIARPALTTWLAQGYRHIPDRELIPAISSTSSWVVLTLLVFVITRLSGGTHPPVDDPELDDKRRLIGALTLLLFVLLFMPAPLVQY